MVMVHVALLLQGSKLITLYRAKNKKTLIYLLLSSVVLNCLLPVSILDSLLISLSFTVCLQDPWAVSQCGVSFVRELQPSCALWGCHGSGHLLCWDRQQGECLPLEPIAFYLEAFFAYSCCYWNSSQCFKIKAYQGCRNFSAWMKHLTMTFISCSLTLICLKRWCNYNNSCSLFSGGK